MGLYFQVISDTNAAEMDWKNPRGWCGGNKLQKDIFSNISKTSPELHR